MVGYTQRAHGPNGGSFESEQRIMIMIEGICTALHQHVQAPPFDLLWSVIKDRTIGTPLRMTNLMTTRQR